MADPRNDAWPRTLVTWSTREGPGDSVSIEGAVAASPRPRALVAGYPETRSLNESVIHRDLICDPRVDGGGDVDGEPVPRDGRYPV